MRQIAPARRQMNLPTIDARRPGWGTVWLVLVAGGIIAFLALPWSLEGKSLAALHGLCAQQPSHSFYFGAHRLPFDARMTGIYGGFACTFAYLLARDRWRYGGVPPVSMMLVLAGFVVALSIDGVNSFLVDAGARHLYRPANAARLATGLLTGTTLAVFIWMLLAQVGFVRTARTRMPALRSWRDIGLLLAVEATFAGVVLTGWSPLRAPLTLLLVVTALAVVSGLALAFVLLAGRREGRASATRELAGPATVALLVALAVIGLTAGGRFLLEAALQLPPPA